MQATTTTPTATPSSSTTQPTFDWPTKTPINCQEIFDDLTNKYKEILKTMGINNFYSTLDGLMQNMMQGNLNAYDRITAPPEFFTKIREANTDKIRHEYVLDYLGSTIRQNLSKEDFVLSENVRCNFLGNNINDISEWGNENGPHYDGDNIDDYLKHNFPFLKPPRSNSLPRPFAFHSFSPSGLLPATPTQPRVNSVGTNQNFTNTSGFTNNSTNNINPFQTVATTLFGQPVQNSIVGGRRKSRKKRKSRRKIPFSKKVRKTKRRRTTKKKRKTKRRKSRKKRKSRRKRRKSRKHR
tara:strand:- start:1545 stop:2432 length:888 start_codon:yes stop_codon:yes gene_type:complete